MDVTARKTNFIIILLGIIVLFISGITLLYLQNVLLPFIIAVLISIIFKPIVVFLESKKFPTAVALIIVVLTLAVILFLIGYLVYSQALAFSETLPKYEQKFQVISTSLQKTFGDLVSSMGLRNEDVNVNNILSFSAITQFAGNFASSFLNFIGNTVLVLLFMLFILGSTGDLTAKIRKGFSSGNAERISTVVDNISKSVRKYLVAKTAISLGTGSLFGIVTWLFGVDFPLFWAFLAFILNFIPNVGSLIATAFPSIFSLLQFDSIFTSIIMMLLLIAIQNIMGNGVEPKIFSNSLNLSSVLILVALIFWGWLWGIIGMILAVPLTATIKIVCENIPALRPISILMGGKVD